MPKKQTKLHPLLIVRKAVEEIDPGISNQQKFSELVGISMSVVGGVENHRYELTPQDRLKVAAATGVDPNSLARDKEALAMNGKTYSPQVFQRWRQLIPKLSTPENRETVQGQGGLMLNALAEVAFRDPSKAIRFILDLDYFLHQQAEILDTRSVPGAPPNYDISYVMGITALNVAQAIPELRNACTKTYTLAEAQSDADRWRDICNLPTGKIWLRLTELHPPSPEAKIFEILEVPNAPAFDHLIGRHGSGISVIKATKRVWRARFMIENGPAEWVPLLELAGVPDGTVADSGPR